MANSQSLVRRLLDTPDIARIVPRLAPEILHRVIDRCGLDACADIVALAAPGQLRRVLDIDLWRASAPGADETFDAQRFAEWLEMLAQMDAAAAAGRVAALDLELIAGGLAEHVRVFDGATVAAYTMLHGEEISGRTFGSQVVELDGLVIEGRATSAWDAIVELFAHLHDARPALFHRLMRACIALSSDAPEQDGFHALLEAGAQHASDLAAARAERRERQGYVAPAEARAFLQAARRLDVERAQPAMDPIARASLRDLVPEPAGDDETAVSIDRAPHVAVIGILSEEGLLTVPRALIGAGTAPDSRLALFHAFAHAHLPAGEELAFLVNALVTGCSIQDRPFTTQEASDAVAATCNLGLENWPPAWRERNLVTAFQIGWAILHRDVAAHAATVSLDVLGAVRCSEEDVQWRLQTLRRELIRHLANGAVWRARPELDAILMLDAAAWAVLRAVLDECPALHASLLSSVRSLRIDPASTTFIARNSEIAVLREWLTTLAVVLAE